MKSNKSNKVRKAINAAKAAKIIKKRKFKIHKGDKVKVIAGKHKGEIAIIVKILTEKNAVHLDKIKGIKHKKASGDSEKGSIVEIFKPIPISNVALVDPIDPTKVTKIGYKFENDQKIRYTKRSNKNI